MVISGGGKLTFRVSDLEVYGLLGKIISVVGENWGNLTGVCGLLGNIISCKGRTVE